MIKTNISDKILDFLRSDLIQNLNILGTIENVPDIEVYVDDVNNPKGVLINKGYFNHIYTKEDSFIEDILNNYCKEDGFYGFSGLEESISKKMRRHFITHWESPCDLYYLPKENYNPSLKKTETGIINLKDAEKIDTYYTYRSDESLGHIKEDIISRPTSGVYKDGEIVSWVLVHDDDSMGIMYTMEGHRGKGYAVDVTIDLSDKIIGMGKIPFLQINQYNNMSPGLATKCGFIKYGRAIWFGGIKGTPKYFSEMTDSIYKNLQEDFSNDDIFLNYIKPKSYADFLLSLLDFKLLDIKARGFELREVKSDEDLLNWCEVTSVGYCKADKDSEKLKKCLYTSIAQNRDTYRLFLGSIDGKFVSGLGFYIIKDELSCLCFLSNTSKIKGEKIDYLTLAGTISLLRKEDWGVTTLRCSKDNSNFYKNLGAVELIKEDYHE